MFARTPFGYLGIAMLAAPIFAFAAYISYLVVPIVLREVIPAVVTTVVKS